MKNPVPSPEEPPFVVIKHLMPGMQLYEIATGEYHELLGGNLRTGSVYLRGLVHKQFREAADDGSYEDELLFVPLPEYIQEINLNDVPGEYYIVVKDAMVIHPPVATQTKAPECRVFETAYARQVRLDKEAAEYAKTAKKAQESGCIPLQLDFFKPSLNQQQA